MKALSLFIVVLIQLTSAQRPCGSSTNNACDNVLPCFDAADAPTATCFGPCGNNCDCGDDEVCRTMKVCGAVTALICRFGCDVCEDDGNDFICLCYSSCPDMSEFGIQVTCGSTTRTQCVGNEYGHPDAETTSGSQTCTISETTPCLSAYSQVDVLDKGSMYLKDVERGDKVLVSSSSDSSLKEYQEIYGFGHKEVYSTATFLQITTSSDQQMPLEITGEHLLMKQISPRDGGHSVRADSIKVGDFLIGSDGSCEEVIQISSVTRPGLYSPVTKDGYLLVNGVQVSSYTSVQNKHPENFVVGNFKMMSHHLMNHAAISPFRSMCLVGALERLCEQRNADGQLLFASKGESIGFWIMEQAAALQIIILPLLSLFIMSFYFLEQLLGGFITMCLLPLSCLLFSGMLCRSFLHKKNNYGKV